MSDLKEVVRVRLAELNRKPLKAAEDAGLERGYLNDILRGRKRRIMQENLPAVARALDWSIDEAMDALGLRGDPKQVAPPTETYTPLPRLFSPERIMPVYAAAEAGDGFIIVSKDAIEYLERPYILESVPDAYAILVTGESMVPAFEPEDKAWINPRLPPARNKDCIFYEADEYSDCKATIKRLISWTDGFWLVQQYSPAKKFKLPRPQWNRCHRVVGKFNA